MSGDGATTQLVILISVVLSCWFLRHVHESKRNIKAWSCHTVCTHTHIYMGVVCVHVASVPS